MLKAIITLLFFAATQASAGSSINDIYGCWTFIHSIHEGQIIPRRDPNLMLFYEFLDKGQSRLWWRQSVTRKFCERHGRYTYADETLEDESTWLNPRNSQTCSSDPDMKVGVKSKTRLVRNGEHIHMDLKLGNSTLIYVARRCSPEEEAMRHPFEKKRH